MGESFAVDASLRRGRPRDQDSAQTRSRLLRVAQALFARYGYDGTSNRQIAEESGITSAAIYHYFSSKAELYAAVYEVVFDKVFAEFRNAVYGHRTLIDQFSAVLNATAKFHDDDPLLPAFVVGVAGDSERHSHLKRVLRPLRRRNSEFVRCLVAQAAARGELHPDVDRRAVEDLLGSILLGMAGLSALTGDARRHAAAVDALERMFAGTLFKG